MSPFSLADFRFLINGLTDLAMQTDKGLVIAVQATESLRQRQVILPALDVIDRACAEAISIATRRIYKTLIEPVEIDLVSDLDLCRSLSLYYPSHPSINRYKLCLENVLAKLRLYISIDTNDRKPLA